MCMEGACAYVITMRLVRGLYLRMMHKAEHGNHALCPVVHCSLLQASLPSHAHPWTDTRNHPGLYPGSWGSPCIQCTSLT